jgi:hypothetical protein
VGRIPAGPSEMKDRSLAITLWIQFCLVLCLLLGISGSLQNGSEDFQAKNPHQGNNQASADCVGADLMVRPAEAKRACPRSAGANIQSAVKRETRNPRGSRLRTRDTRLPFSKLPISFEYRTLRNHTFQLAEVRPAYHGHDWPSVDISQSDLQWMVRMQERQLPDGQQRAEL